MPIVVENAPIKPAIVYNQVHMRELRIVLTEDQQAKANVRIVYSLFGRDAEGVKHIDKAQHVLLIEDAFSEAEAKAAVGDFALATALGAIEGAIASIMHASGRHGAVTQEA